MRSTGGKQKKIAAKRRKIVYRLRAKTRWRAPHWKFKNQKSKFMDFKPFQKVHVKNAVKVHEMIWWYKFFIPSVVLVLLRNALVDPGEEPEPMRFFIKFSYRPLIVKILKNSWIANSEKFAETLLENCWKIAWTFLKHCWNIAEIWKKDRIL